MAGNTSSERESQVREVTDRTFEAEVEQSQRPTVVMFHTVTCPHCRTLRPVIEALALDFHDRVRFVALDAGANPWTAERYGVRAIPTLKFFCRGRPVQELVGAIAPAAVRRQVEEFEVRGEECVRSSTELAHEVTGYG